VNDVPRHLCTVSRDIAVCPVEVVEPLHGAGPSGHQPRRPTRLFDCLPWLRQLDLLNAFRSHEERDRLALQ
jgi:hypothetical protein